MQVFGDPASRPGSFYKADMGGGTDGAVFSPFNAKFMVVDSFTFMKQDSVQPMKCLGDKAYINLFGRGAVANLRVTLNIFLVECGHSSGVVSEIKSRFDDSRISTNQSPVCNLTIGSTHICRGYAVGLQVNAETNENNVAHASVDVMSLTER
jgi:hypothetical protein